MHLEVQYQVLARTTVVGRVRFGLRFHASRLAICFKQGLLVNLFTEKVLQVLFLEAVVPGFLIGIEQLHIQILIKGEVVFIGALYDAVEADTLCQVLQALILPLGVGELRFAVLIQ